jgi:TMEM175 potassium channel family protein
VAAVKQPAKTTRRRAPGIRRRSSLGEHRLSETERTETFSDDVLAIAVTLLVLGLSVPVRDTLHTSLATALTEQWPAYAAYVTSFLVIGIIWVNHHAVFELIGMVDRITLFLNLLLLMSVVTIPFTTALLSEYLTASIGNARTAALVYSAVMLAVSCGFAGLYIYVTRNPALLAEGVDPHAMHASFVRFSVVGILLYVATLVVALFSASLCLLAHLLIALYYCFEQIRPIRRPATSPVNKGPG